MKKASDLLKNLNEEEKEKYSDLVQTVSELVGKSYIVTLEAVKNYEPSELKALYTDCIAKWRDFGFNSPAHMFWTRRKERLKRK